MEETTIVIMLKDEETGFLDQELGSYSVPERAELIWSIYVKSNEVVLRLSCDRELEDWEYEAVFDYYDTEPVGALVDTIIEEEAIATLSGLSGSLLLMIRMPWKESLQKSCRHTKKSSVLFLMQSRIKRMITVRNKGIFCLLLAFCVFLMSSCNLSSPLPPMQMLRMERAAQRRLSCRVEKRIKPMKSRRLKRPRMMKKRTKSRTARKARRISPFGRHPRCMTL